MGLRAGWGKKAELLPSAGRLRMTLGLSGEYGDEVDLLVEGGRPGWDAEMLLQSVGVLSAIWHRPSGDGVKLEDGGGIAHFGAICLTQIPGDPESVKGSRARGLYWTKPNKSGKEVSRDMTIDEKKYSAELVKIDSNLYSLICDGSTYTIAIQKEGKRIVTKSWIQAAINSRKAIKDRLTKQYGEGTEIVSTAVWFSAA